MKHHIPSLFDFPDEGGVLISSGPTKRKRGRPKLVPLPQGTGKAPTDGQRRADSRLNSEARREALNRWVVQSTREPNKRDFTRAVLQMLADHVDLDPASPTYLQCENLKQQEIADGIGVSVVCVSSVIRRLAEPRIISTERVGRTGTQYTLHPAPLSSIP